MNAATILEMLKAEGLKVYMRKLKDEYCFVTDGTYIAYVQWSGYHNSVCSVHRSNRQTGTGFEFASIITPQLVREAMKTIAPNWASAADRASVHKYKDWNEYHTKDAFNKELFEV